MQYLQHTVLALLCATLLGTVHANLGDRDELSEFAQHMESEHAFDQDEVLAFLRDVEHSEEVIEWMETPFEALPWHAYRELFLTDRRITKGAEFMEEHAELLADVEDAYGVPAPVLTAILGIETNYGEHTGDYRVLDTLATLGFDYEPRAEFFRTQLEEFLLLVREEEFDIDELNGSFAGAMGLPQFIPSSYRKYAVDFNGDGQRDLLNSVEDATGSIGNYLKEHDWRAGEGFVLELDVDEERLEAFERSTIHPEYELAELKEAGLELATELPEDAPVGLLALEGEENDEYWLAKHNFFVITRYNPSPLYAMAVVQLAEAIEHEMRNLTLDETL